MFERWKRGEQISWLYYVWMFEREGFAKIISRSYMRLKSGKLVQRQRYWGCKRG